MESHPSDVKGDGCNLSDRTGNKKGKAEMGKENHQALVTD